MPSPTGISSGQSASLATHRSAEPDPRARGRAFGAAMAPQVATTVQSYRRLFAAASGLEPEDVRQRGARVGASLAAWPELVEEIAGIAEGAGQDAHELLAINARTELLAPATRPECTFVGALPHATATGETLMAQNWDWHPGQADALVVWTIELPDDAGSLTTLTEAGIVAKIGLNSRGLGVCLNMLGSSHDGGEDGVPIHLLLRLVLERCATVAEAVELLLAAPVTASSSVNVGSAGGGQEAALVSVELCPAGSRCVWPGEDGTLAHTNHFVHPDLASLDTDVVRWPETVERHRLADAHMARAAGRVDVGEVETLLRSHENAPASVCLHEDASMAYDDRDATLASVIMRLEAASMTVVPGPPCRHGYVAMTGGDRLLKGDIT